MEGVVLLAGVLLVASSVRCVSPSRPGLPPGSPFAPEASVSRAWFPQGVAAGDVTSRSAQIWLRTGRPGRAELVWGPAGAAGGGEIGQGGRFAAGASGSTTVETDASRDLTAQVALDGLLPGTAYVYRARVLEPGASEPGDEPPDDTAVGRFRTAPAEGQAAPVTFVWSSDLGGQGRCRRGEEPYAIFDRMRALEPDFAILLGDLIYADERCPVPPNAPGSEFIAEQLEQFRRKHRYQRGAPAMRRFLAAVPVYVTWDDHEVRDNFSGPSSPLMPHGRRAFFEYWPIDRHAGMPTRLYRRIRYGADLEVFMLDTRQYRSPNEAPDDPDKTMLGEAQRTWLLEALGRTTATWTVIASSVPLSIRKPGTLRSPGNDSWTRGADRTGFHVELEQIVRTIMAERIGNVVWLAGDVHFAQLNAFDPDRDGRPDFYEFISGPLSAEAIDPATPEPAFGPTPWYSGGGWFSFGAITVKGPRLTVEIRDDQGRVRARRTLDARAPR